MNFVEPIRSKSDVEKIKNYFLTRKMRSEYLLFVIGINSCLRISDLLHLKWEQLISNGEVLDTFKVKERKTGKTKIIKSNKSIHNALQEAYEGQTGYVFISKSNAAKGNVWSRQYVWQALKRAANKVGIKENIGTHTMRKTFGYFRREMGVPLQRLMRVFNHSSEAITLKYLGYTQEEDNEIYESINL